jgi:hypothetical protein
MYEMTLLLPLISEIVDNVVDDIGREGLGAFLAVLKFC